MQTSPTPQHTDTGISFQQNFNDEYNSHAEEDQSEEHKEVVALEVVNVLDDPLGQWCQAVGHLEVLGVDEVPPWLHLLPRLVEPFPRRDIGQGNSHQSAGEKKNTISSDSF